MKINSFKKRAIALLSTSALLVTIVSAAPASAAATDPICDGKTPIQTCLGKTSDGAGYEIRVPSNFNGTVALWSHGLGVSWAVPAGLLPPFPNGIPVDPMDFILEELAPKNKYYNYIIVGNINSHYHSRRIPNNVKFTNVPKVNAISIEIV